MPFSFSGVEAHTLYISPLNPNPEKPQALDLNPKPETLNPKP